MDARLFHTIDPSCKNVIKEFNVYSWGRTRDGLVDPLEKIPKPQLDHAIDATRYALEPIIFGTKGRDKPKRPAMQGAVVG